LLPMLPLSKRYMMNGLKFIIRAILKGSYPSFTQKMPWWCRRMSLFAKEKTPFFFGIKRPASWPMNILIAMYLKMCVFPGS